MKALESEREQAAEMGDALGDLGFVVPEPSAQGALVGVIDVAGDEERIFLTGNCAVALGFFYQISNVKDGAQAVRPAILFVRALMWRSLSSLFFWRKPEACL